MLFCWQFFPDRICPRPSKGNEIPHNPSRSHNPLRRGGETIARLHRDVIRRITGTITSWNDEPPSEITKLVQNHLHEAEKKMAQVRMEEIPLLSQTTAVTIQTDASNSGFGSVLIIEKRICYAWRKGDSKQFNKLIESEQTEVNQRSLFRGHFCRKKTHDRNCC